MSDYIKREDAIKALCDDCGLIGKCEKDHIFCTSRKKLNKIPSEDVRENVRGTWIKNENGWMVCSACGNEADGDDKGYFLNDFCGYCGADMRGENNE